MSSTKNENQEQQLLAPLGSGIVLGMCTQNRPRGEPADSDLSYVCQGVPPRTEPDLIHLSQINAESGTSAHYPDLDFAKQSQKLDEALGFENDYGRRKRYHKREKVRQFTHRGVRLYVKY